MEVRNFVIGLSYLMRYGEHLHENIEKHIV